MAQSGVAAVVGVVKRKYFDTSVAMALAMFGRHIYGPRDPIPAHFLKICRFRCVVVAKKCVGCRIFGKISRYF